VAFGGGSRSGHRGRRADGAACRGAGRRKSRRAGKDDRAGRRGRLDDRAGGRDLTAGRGRPPGGSRDDADPGGSRYGRHDELGRAVARLCRIGPWPPPWSNPARALSVVGAPHSRPEGPASAPETLTRRGATGQGRCPSRNPGPTPAGPTQGVVVVAVVGEWMRLTVRVTRGIAGARLRLRAGTEEDHPAGPQAHERLGQSAGLGFQRRGPLGRLLAPVHFHAHDPHPSRRVSRWSSTGRAACAAGAAPRYFPVWASMSAAVFGIGGPRTRLPSSVIRTSSSMRMPPKSR